MGGPGWSSKTERTKHVQSRAPTELSCRKCIQAILASGIRAVTITDPALGMAHRPARHVLHQLAEHLRTLLSTGSIGADVGVGGQVENGREQA